VEPPVVKTNYSVWKKENRGDEEKGLEGSGWEKEIW